MSSEIMQVVLMDRVRAHGPMLEVCPAPGCSALTMGGTCVEHDPPLETTFPRGRPYPARPAKGTAPVRLVDEPLRAPTA
ncbi:MAG TPA: hypothetical protein VH305_11170 [Gaiella sp.]|jgi:hypothetical protein